MPAPEQIGMDCLSWRSSRAGARPALAAWGSSGSAAFARRRSLHALVGLLDIGVSRTQGAVAIEVLGGQKLSQSVAQAQANSD